MPNMGSFSPNMSPEDLRNLVIFPTFMIHLPKILDKAVQGIITSMTSFELYMGSDDLAYQHHLNKWNYYYVKFQNTLCS